MEGQDWMTYKPRIWSGKTCEFPWAMGTLQRVEDLSPPAGSPPKRAPHERKWPVQLQWGLPGLWGHVPKWSPTLIPRKWAPGRLDRTLQSMRYVSHRRICIWSSCHREGEPWRDEARKDRAFPSLTTQVPSHAQICAGKEEKIQFWPSLR